MRIKAKPTGKFKSRLEAGLSDFLQRKLGEAPPYEADAFSYTIEAEYTPDFKMTDPKTGKVFYLEAKGYFDAEDRRKMLRVIACNPALDVRMIFSNPKNKISKGSKTTYAGWCDKHGIRWAASNAIPKEWLCSPCSNTT